VVKTTNVAVTGTGSPTLVFVHGYGCDQNMWRFVAPAFSGTHRSVLYDLVGMGQSDYAAYDFDRYRTLDAHAEDLGAILTELDIDDAVLVGHSVGATIACLTATQVPDRVKALALVAPSPSFIHDGDYVGGFDRSDIEGLIEMMEQNFLGWTQHVTPLIAGPGDDGTASGELTQSFCRTDPAIAKHFGRVTFLADHRKDMSRVSHPALILQVADDTLAPTDVGAWLDRHMPGGELTLVDAIGHCPHMTEPEKAVAELRKFIERLS